MARSYDFDNDWCDDTPGPPILKIPSIFAVNANSSSGSSGNPVVAPSKSTQPKRVAGQNDVYDGEDDYVDDDDDDWDMHYYTGDSKKTASGSVECAETSSTKPSKASLTESRNTLIALETPLGSVEYDQDVLERLCQLWDAKPVIYRQVSQQLQEAFENTANPYLTTMYLVQAAPEYHKAKTTGMALCILKEFDKWIASRHQRYSKCLNELVKKDAFLIAIRAAHFTYVDHIVRCFLLCHDGNDYLLKYIYEFLAEKKYKEAATCVTKLQLQKYFNIKDIVLPLIVQDKTTLAESYVAKDEQLQLALVTLLDELVADRRLALELVKQLEIPDVKWEKLEPKKLSKLAVRLLKAYNLPQAACPHVDAVRSEKALRFLLFRRYIEQSLEESQWSELVECTVGTSAYLQVKLVDELVTYQDVPEAARWAYHYDMAPFELPSQVNDFLASLPDRSLMTLNREVTVTASDKYHSLSLPRSAIHWVDDSLTFYECVHTLSQSSGPLGIDAEWRPTLGQTLNPRVSIVQVATDSHVYLLDILRLSSLLTDNDWLLFGSQVLANDALIKMGYGISEDLHMLTASVPCIDDFMGACRVLDLHHVHAKMGMIAPGVFDDAVEQHEVNDPTSSGEKGKSGERGLSEMVRCYLGRPLDKSQQMSDWERRPLREAQVLYAALDALSVVQVYRVIEPRLQHNGLDLVSKFTFTMARKSKPGKYQAIAVTAAAAAAGGGGNVKLQAPSGSKQTSSSASAPSNLDLDSWPSLSASVGVTEKSMTADQPRVTGTSKKSSVAQRIAGSVKPPASPVPPVPASPARSPDTLRVVVDTMLQGLGRQLRCCGVDVCILNTDDDHLKAMQISHLESRVILTSGTPYAMLNAKLPPGRCLFIPCSLSAKDQAAIVFRHFGVEVTEADIFSRCQVCNGNKYVTIPASEVEAMWSRSKGQGQPTRSSQSPPPVTDNREYDPLTVTLPNGVPIQLDTIPASVIRSKQVFYVCASCGKVFWDGLHYDNIRQQFAHLLTPNTAAITTATAAVTTAVTTATAAVTTATAAVTTATAAITTATAAVTTATAAVTTAASNCVPNNLSVGSCEESSTRPAYDYDSEVWD